MNAFQKDLEKTAVSAAKAAAKILLKYHHERNFTVSYKGDVNLVTTADIESEKCVIETIRKAFPTHAILSEENKSSHEGSLEGPVWVIDPLDGTTNFSHGFPLFSVSIAFRENNKTIFGLTYLPVLDEMFIAHAGHGATLNGKKISVSKNDNINQSLLSTGFAYDRRESPVNNLKEFCIMEMNCQDMRRTGAATVDLAYVACGKFEGYWEYKLAAWDVAAGELLVQEAGVKVTDFRSKAITNLWNGETLASNGLIHDSMLDLLQDAKKFT